MNDMPVIARRMLTFRETTGERRIEIRIQAPVLVDGQWLCPYEIDWPEGTKRMEAGGFDSVQALLIALQMIGAELYTSTYHRESRLFFDKPDNGYGFPVGPALRDLLVGDDARFLG